MPPFGPKPYSSMTSSRVIRSAILTAHGYGKWSLAGSILTIDTLLLHGLVINPDLCSEVCQRSLTVLWLLRIDKLPNNMWSSRNPEVQQLANHIISTFVLVMQYKKADMYLSKWHNGLRYHNCLHRNLKE